MVWRYWLIDVPALIATKAWYAYWIFIAAGTILCFVNAGLAVLFYLLGIRLIWP
jgi:hypothetical protein